ncbi:hypothetical protein DS884_02825 [Tenacibaculum sp. E3R01]|nr:hypothetical protein DS884_02825 [Tenacibaculum sp. E3R01]
MVKQFTFYIKDEKENNFYFDFYKVKKERDHFSIILYGVNEKINNILNIGHEVIISFKDCFVNIYFTIKEYTLITSDKIQIKTSLKSYLCEKNNNFLAELLYSWKINEVKYQWYELSKNKKRLWLSSCCSIKNTGYGKNLITSNIYLHLKNIKTMLDFYCYLGDKFLGYRGYIGSNLDALDDMLIEISEESIRKTKIYLFDFDSFNKKMNQSKKAKKNNIDYGSSILEIFKDRKLNYMIV